MKKKKRKKQNITSSHSNIIGVIKNCVLFIAFGFVLFLFLPHIPGEVNNRRIHAITLVDLYIKWCVVYLTQLQSIVVHRVHKQYLPCRLSLCIWVFSLRWRFTAPAVNTTINN